MGRRLSAMAYKNHRSVTFSYEQQNKKKRLNKDLDVKHLDKADFIAFDYYEIIEKFNKKSSSYFKTIRYGMRNRERKWKKMTDLERRSWRESKRCLAVVSFSLSDDDFDELQYVGSTKSLDKFEQKKKDDAEKKKQGKEGKNKKNQGTGHQYLDKANYVSFGYYENTGKNIVMKTIEDHPVLL